MPEEINLTLGISNATQEDRAILASRSFGVFGEPRIITITMNDDDSFFGSYFVIIAIIVVVMFF